MFLGTGIYYQILSQIFGVKVRNDTRLSPNLNWHHRNGLSKGREVELREVGDKERIAKAEQKRQRRRYRNLRWAVLCNNARVGR